MSKYTCAYCGKTSGKPDKEHVIPRCLYPSSKKQSKVQKITIPSCQKCNNSWANDEAHFRNILILSGDPTTPEKQELWNTTVNRSFLEIDGKKRIKDLIVQMKPVTIGNANRHMVFPGNDERVLRVTRKIIRGLSYYHNLEWPIDESRIWVDILKYEILKDIFDRMEYHDRDKDVFEYRFQEINESDIRSAWVLTFYTNITFLGLVSSMPNAPEINPLELER